ncbi:MAG: phospholipid/cholesterol/gamma-HCH transport system ATP-binding protein [Blastocatellia bacterium]
MLLHLAIGLLQPDDEQILIAGQRIDGLTEGELLAIRGQMIGLAFQEDTLFTSLSVYDNAAYRLVEHGWSETDTDQAVREILCFVGLENDAEKLPDELSIGMRRRLEIARALVGCPRRRLNGRLQIRGAVQISTQLSTSRPTQYKNQPLCVKQKPIGA